MSTSELVETNLADIPAATEATLIETVLGSPGIAEKILIANGLVGIARMSPVALAERAGISVKEAHRLVAAFELGHRVEIARTRRPKRLRTSRDIATFFGPTLRGLVHEEVWIAGLDAWQGVRGVRMVARGGLHGATLRPADVLRGALELGAISFVLCHNHPSGDPKPTDEDIVMTNEIEHRAHLIGVELVDHVVVCPNGKYASVFKR
ncbi:JAB domain-containing protein [Sorangium sp. So ce1389]|uniref:JAB domain-containing protein n=1 Tax=Sorangium sp. So ce1389 TaxID=3133336 RepID=UPI003F630E4A